MSDFGIFWAHYPRKVAKKDAQNAWNKLTSAQKQAAMEALPKHVKLWDDPMSDPMFIPYPASWLNGERWEDELTMPEPKKPEADWWRSTAGIEAKARELGMWPPRAGEDWHSLKARILARAA